MHHGDVGVMRTLAGPFDKTARFLMTIMWCCQPGQSSSRAIKNRPGWRSMPVDGMQLQDCLDRTTLAAHFRFLPLHDRAATKPLQDDASLSSFDF
ncbi:uncharacterized protein CTRU02_202358 [Colletotrichum truncatum]|uniref:Uncharacterized protein n=1 Tax=Colletotrichum truncatum TaxID=5467 RepID=A0ACC3ZK05_COLTU